MKSFLVVMFFIPAFALAGIEDPVTNEEFLRQLLNFVISPKGATLAVVAAIVQLAMVFVVTPFGSFIGKQKLAVLYSLSAVLALVGSLASGMSIVEALLSGTFLAAIMNAVHRWIKPSETVL